MRLPLALDPLGSEAERALRVFLARSRTVLVGRIDGRGVVVAANPALRRWIAVSGRCEPRLDTALTAPSRRRWRRVLADGGSSRNTTLWFGTNLTERVAFRCRLVADGGETFWFCGEPRSDPVASALRAALERSRRRARRLAGTDVLTGLANRRLGLRRLVVWAESARQQGAPLACLMVDLDQFKAVNDTYGHPIGDRVLRAAARTLAQGLRGTDLIARYGGDEFLIVLPGTTAADAAAIAERLKSRLVGSSIAPLGWALGASLGIAALRPGESARNLLARADDALLRAKREGRGRVADDPPAGDGGTAPE